MFREAGGVRPSRGSLGTGAAMAPMSTSIEGQWAQGCGLILGTTDSFLQMVRNSNRWPQA